MGKKYFGTDGVRGTVGNDPMNADFAMRLASAAAQVLVPKGGTVVIGKDTRLSGYMFESALEAGFVAAGATLIKDVAAKSAEGAMQAAAELGVPVCLNKIKGEPRTMHEKPHYDGVVADVAASLESRSAACVAAGIGEELIVVDPGFGFGKTHGHNVELLANLRQLRVRERPVLVGVSRKSTLGDLTQREVHERMPASVAAAVVAVVNGASIVRAHDVQATVDALKVAQAVIEAGE